MSCCKKALAFVMTYAVSLSLWHRLGLLDREVKVLKFLSRLYDKVFLFTYGGFEDIRYIDYLPRNTIVLINFTGSNLLYSLLAPFIYRRLLRRFKLVVCRTVQLFGCWLCLILKLLYGSKFILRQGYQLSKFLRRERRILLYLFARLLEFLSYLLADVIVVTSEKDKKYIVEKYHVNPSKVYVIPNWVDVNVFKPMHNIEKEKGRIVFVGRLEHQKNVFALVDAVKTLPNIKLYIVGEGTLKKPLEYKIEKERISNVVLLGAIPNEKLPYELNRAEIFVLPSLWEGHPKALIEAMACGLPVIGSDVEGIKEVIVHGFNGLLCKPDPKSIRSTILTLINNPELRKKLGENARRFVVENYSIEKVMRKELALHLWLLETSGKQYKQG